MHRACLHALSLLLLLACAPSPQTPSRAPSLRPPDAADTEAAEGTDDGSVPDDDIDGDDPDAGDGAPVVVPPASGCGRTPRESGLWTLEHEGLTRSFDVAVPERATASTSTPLPVVFNFHGRHQSAAQQRWLTGLDGAGNARGAVVVTPHGIDRTWSAGLCCGSAMEQDVDDVGFTAAMIDALAAHLCIDLARVTATGLSNGGFMVHHLACRLSDRIAAVAAVAGPNGTPQCTPVRPVPVLHIHGTADTIVPFDGFAGFASVPGTIDGWRARNRCESETTTTYAQGPVRCSASVGCAADVELCVVTGGGHQWPGGFTIPGLGMNTDDIDASEAILDFLLAR